MRGHLAAGTALAVLLVAGFSMNAPVAGQTGALRTPIDLSRLGPQVGQQVPDFSLTDQSGKAWTRQSIAGPKGAMLVFIRSADW
jgi:hypothetical protein